MTTKIKFTEARVRKLTLPPGKTDHTFWDAEVPGLGRRLRAGRSAAWIVRLAFAGKQERIVLAPSLTVAQARAEATQHVAAQKRGDNPKQAIRAKVAAARAAQTIGDLLEDYLKYKKPDLKPRTLVELTRQLMKHAKPIHDMPVKALDHERIADLLRTIGRDHPTLANHVRAALADFGKWLIGEGKTTFNVFAATNRASPVVADRDRAPDVDELALFWDAAPDNAFGAVLKVLMLSGCRRSEIAGLRRSEIDRAKGIAMIPPARMKAARQKKIREGDARGWELVLTPAMLAVIDAQPQIPGRDLIFGTAAAGISGWSDHKEQLDAKIAELAVERGVPVPAAWTLHHLRRSMSTTMNEAPPKGLGVQPHVVEECLSHVTVFKQGVAGRYNLAAYRDDKRRALTLWNEHLLATIEGRDAKVVPIKQTAS
jgi:integrase